MTNTIQVIVFILLAVWISDIYAEPIHRVGAQAEVHYSHNFALPELKMQYGMGASGNIVYELKKNHFLWQIGAGLSYNHSAIHNLTYAGVIGEMIDTDGDPCIYSYRLDNKRDTQHQVGVILPIMFGAQIKAFYFLLGAKGNLHLWDKVNTQAKLSTMGEYIHLIAPLQAMDNHYFWSDRAINNSRILRFYGDIALAGEVGMELPDNSFYSLTSTHLIHRVAVFVEYGLYSSYKIIPSSLIDFHINSTKLNNIQFNEIEMQPLSFSDKQTTKSAMPFHIGVRWTMLMEFPPHKTCMCPRY